MPFPSPDLLAAAAADLAGCHPLTIVTIPALLRAGKPDDDNLFAESAGLPVIMGFGTKQERPVLEAFRVRDGKRPYLAVWQDPPAFINGDYPGSTLQRLRTQDLLGQQLFEIAWNEDHTKRVGTALRPTAGSALRTQGVKNVSRFSLAVWLARHVDLDGLEDYLNWFDHEYPLDGTDLDDFYVRDIPDFAVQSEPMEARLWVDEPEDTDLIEAIKPVPDDQQSLEVPSTTPPKAPETVAEPDTVDDDSDSLSWTRDFCEYPLRYADAGKITQAVLDRLEAERIVLPDAESLVRRCVTALLVGHLVLQGPPGTGKTTLARILATAFNVSLLESTATSEWSPFHVVGGLRPAQDGSLQPSYGKVADAALKCALQVRADVTAEAEGQAEPTERRRQGTWLLIDEFNRADIDKAVGSLYTVLSSVDPTNLRRSPIDLWFESAGRQQLWVPSRFRIIAAMNDLDTSFVNPISQGLTRRFQFITIGTPPSEGTETTSTEMESSFATAYSWLSSTYGSVLTLDELAVAESAVQAQMKKLQTLVYRLRETNDAAAGWPIGTAQVVDALRVLLIQVSSGTDPDEALDWCVADRLVPQMGQLDEPQLLRAQALFDDAGLANARNALKHLIDPHGV